LNELGLGRTAKAQNGDQKAWNVLFRKYNRVLLRLAFLILGSLDQARDVVQETFIKLNQIKPKHFEGKFKSYLMVIAHRLALKEKNRLKPFTKISEEHLPQNTDLFIDDQRTSLLMIKSKQKRSIRFIKQYQNCPTNIEIF